MFTFFTLVAAADVPGLQLHLRGEDHLALVLWLAALSIWIALSYFSFAVLTFDEGQTGADVVHGGWLIAIVGTESLVLLGAPLAGEFGSLEDTIFVAVHALWGIGIVFYGIFVTLFAYRIFFLPVDAAEMNSLFWVVMAPRRSPRTRARRLILTSPTAVPSRHAPVRERDDADPRAWATWWIRCSRSSASGNTSSAANRCLRADVLEPRVPARDVRGRHLPTSLASDFHRSRSSRRRWSGSRSARGSRRCRSLASDAAHLRAARLVME